MIFGTFCPEEEKYSEYSGNYGIIIQLHRFTQHAFHCSEYSKILCSNDLHAHRARQARDNKAHRKDTVGTVYH